MLESSELLTTGYGSSGSTVHGSSHVYGLAWLPDTLDVEQLPVDTSDDLEEGIVKHADQLVSTTINPAVI